MKELGVLADDCCCFFPYIYFNLIKHRTASFIVFVFFKKLSLLLLSSSEMQRMFLTVSNFPVPETGSKKALFFIHNDTPKLSLPKYFDSSKKQNL